MTRSLVQSSLRWPSSLSNHQRRSSAKKRGENSPAIEALIHTIGKLGALLGKVALSVAATALGISTGNARVLTLGRSVSDLSTVPASIEVLARLVAITHPMVKSLAVVALEHNTVLHVILGLLNLAVGAEMSLL